MITAYDATMAKLVDAGGVDMVLVGDSVGMVVQGMDDTLSVTLDDMVYHGRCVARGLSRAHLTVDMPFMSYQVSPEQALQSAGRLVQEGKAQSVKLEGGERSASAVEKIVAAGIPVVGHIGLTPQSVNTLGGWRVQGRSDAAAEQPSRMHSPSRMLGHLRWCSRWCRPNTPQRSRPHCASPPSASEQGWAVMARSSSAMIS